MNDQMLRVLHLEDNDDDAKLVESALARSGLVCDTRVAATRGDFLSALESGAYDVVLSDSSVPGFDGRSALEEARHRFPSIPFIFVSGNAAARRADDTLPTERVACVDKSELDQLAAVVLQTVQTPATDLLEAEAAPSATKLLVNVIQKLSLARNLPTVVALVRHAARELTGADGATFVLRDGDMCHYVDENAIAPLWKGKRFPQSACISGWVMQHRQPAVIEDIEKDERIPIDVYRPTFVKSLVMVPIRTASPLGAIGNYWATPHKATADELRLLQALADSTSIAMENVQLYNDLEQRVQERTARLDADNMDLKAFCFSVSHDLRAPLRRIDGFSQLLLERSAGRVDETDRDYLQRIRVTTLHMRQLIDDLLTLSRITRAELIREPVDLSAMAAELAADLQSQAPERRVEFSIADGMIANADPRLLRVAMENLLANAWKYTGKRPDARITVGCSDDAGQSRTFFVEDNGAGFDMLLVDKLFKPFQRLHADSEFQGTGIGLATVQRIIQKHGGRIWGKGTPGMGATFSFTLD